MDGLCITNYCDRRCSPFTSITRVSEEEARRLAKQLAANISPAFTSFSRFGEDTFDGYYQKRLRTEVWLYEHFVALGGKPHSRHPLYFVLQESTYLEQWYENGIKTRLPLGSIDAADISFTYGDSMSRMDSADRMNPFTKESLSRFLQKKSDDVVSFLQELNKQNRYIEVQLWNDRYVQDLVCCHPRMGKDAAHACDGRHQCKA